ncbi:hypothetical protein Q3V94_08310 [Caloramator sp. CAR-1]|uniref:hypothetical protein n=1 Tax=Caloramator sp. CAR-1 TaxID=3062777 RepID=UPI0026E24C35|nr:hypothetical protein [Caloramator sp. CAR-1]MDO6355079.1 hypothetical protein [Caloramator sp. CAR-1]
MNNQKERLLNEEVNCEVCSQSSTGVGCECCCNGSQNITFKPCEDVIDYTVGPYDLKCEGRFLKVRVRLKNVCCNRKINVGVLVCEPVDGTFYTRGFKACQIVVPGTGCKDVTIDEFCFVFPDEDLCRSKTYVVKVVAHYAEFPSFSFCPC